jgi:hypothetical protein
MDFRKENSVVRVSFAGGIIGILAGSHRGRLEKAIIGQNKLGWNLAEVIPDSPNLVIWIFRLILLMLTLGLWTISTGYILVFERPTSDRQRVTDDIKGRREPVISAAGKTTQ